MFQGGEPFQPVTTKADRSNGYVKGNKGMADVQPKASEMVSRFLSMCSSVFGMNTCPLEHLVETQTSYFRA